MATPRARGAAASLSPDLDLNKQQMQASGRTLRGAAMPRGGGDRSGS